jgi:hypothetical protein
MHYRSGQYQDLCLKIPWLHKKKNLDLSKLLLEGFGLGFKAALAS